MAHILTVDGHTPSLDPSAFVAATAVLAGQVQLGAGASVWFGCVLRSERSTITIGRDTNLQDLTVVHTDEGVPTTIGDRVTVGHRALLHGCTVEDDALIGMGAILLNGSHVGAGAVVAAGAVVREGQHVPAGALAVGVPARIRTDVDLPSVPRRNVAGYLALAELYRTARPVDPPAQP
jgi:carbonic anhydrase/acetyltransferase-like protein (isoleucine patch superfamily)